METIRNPVEWTSDQLKDTTQHLESVGRSIRGTEGRAESGRPALRQIEVADLKELLARGFADFGVYRTDVVFLCLIYPVVGLVVARFAFDSELLQLLFPVTFGFALLGPIAAVGLYEMSRQAEEGHKASWVAAFGVVRSPSFGAILLLGLLLLTIFLLWLAAAQVIYMNTLGPEPPASLTAFARDVFTTGAGWAMIVVGMAVGICFAVLVLAISVVSFPMLLDRKVSAWTAGKTSIRVVMANPMSMALWGIIVAVTLAVGTLPMFVGLAIVLPVLGHATWHLYRTVVEH